MRTREKKYMRTCEQCGTQFGVRAPGESTRFCGAECFGMTVRKEDRLECTRCHQTKTLMEFRPRKSPMGRSSNCRQCDRDADALRRADPQIREAVRTRKRDQRYDLAPGEYDAMLAQQCGRCAICGLQNRLVIDHCHATGKVRGLLCHPCNTALGMLRDSESALNSAIAYLRNAKNG